MNQSLNGTWEYRIGKGVWQERQVPFSALAVGHSECRRTFDLEQTMPRTFLRFDGITYAAEVTLNGQKLGKMGPYCEYEFEITDCVRPVGNELLVELEDIAPAFGPSEGWQNYGGITRNVQLVYRNERYIEDVFFVGHASGDYTLTMQGEGRWRISLDGQTVQTEQKEYAGRVEAVRCWSPDEPNLYDLKVELLDGDRVLDTYEAKVGFRDFTCDDHELYLNGKPIFLRGVCKHEMVGESGHTLTYEQIEEDLKKIKATGCNYVRLVHYPHDKRTLEITDRIGLMTSEEPGLWWSDTAVAEVAQGSIEVLQRTIMRDRNHASIVFWLCFNECRFTEQYLIDSAKACRELDSTRLVSGANCMSPQDTVTYYNKCGFDFYTMHPYYYNFDRARLSAEILCDKPLVFTEWGGMHVFDKPALLREYIRNLIGLKKKKKLAGASFWYWMQGYDYNRSRPACEDGKLMEHLINVDGTPSSIYETFCNSWDEDMGRDEFFGIERFDSCDKTPLTCQDKGDYLSLMDKIVSPVPEHLVRMRKRQLLFGPMLEEEPAVLSDGGELVFEGEVASDCVTLIGCVSAPKGYPIAGEYGEAAAEVVVEYEDGEQTVPLRNGLEFTTVFTTLSSSRINPKAENATPYAEFHYDKNFENYLINRLDIPLAQTQTVKRVRIRSKNAGYDLLFYGVYA